MSKVQIVWFRDLKLWDLKSNLFDNEMFANSKFPLVQVSTFLHRNKTPIKIQNNETYKRVTIKTKGQGCHLRDTLKGSLIGTKNQFLIKEGQFLISKIDARNGAFGVVGKDIHNAIITGNFWTYDIDTSKVNAYFLALFTSTKYFIDFCKACSGGTTGRHYLDENKFLNAKIPLPPLEIQKQIVAQIESIKAQIKALQVEEKRLKDEIEAYIYIALGLEKKQEAKRQKVFIVRFKDLDRWDTRHNQSIAINLCHTDSASCHTDTTSPCHTEAIAEVSTNIESKRDFDTLSLRGVAKAFHNPQNNIKADFTESMDCHDFATQNLAMTGLDLKAPLDSIPTPPPHGWEVKTLGKICEINPKIDFKELTKLEKEVSFLPMEAVKTDGKTFEKLQRKAKEAQGFTKFADNDLLWAKITPCMQNKKSLVVSGLKNGFGFGSTEFFVLRSKDSRQINIHFILQFLRLDLILQNASETFKGSAGQQRVPKEFLQNLKIPLPPLSVQEKILAHIQKIESSIATTQNKAKALELELTHYIESTL